MMTTGQTSNFRALIVDDDEVVHQILSEALGDEGFECDTAANGEDALRILLAERPYDLLIADLRMPGKNGHALSIEALKSQPGLVVIVHTLVEEPRLTKDLIRRGVDDVIFKPANYHTFAAKARGYVARRRRKRSGANEMGHEPALSDRDTPASCRADSSRHAGEFDGSPISADEVQERLDDLGRLLPLSRVAFDAYSMATRDDCEPEDLAATIQQEDALTADVLQLANCTHSSSGPGEIDSVDRAIVRLGRGAVGRLALSAGARQTLSGHEIPWIDCQLHWKRSLLATVALRSLKARAAVHTDHSEFLGTLLHSVGRITLATLFPDQHRKLAEQCRETGNSLDIAEEKAFGLTHGQVGSRLLESWGISAKATRPIEHLAMTFDQLHRHPESIRHRIENVKLSILLAHIALSRWEPWDLIDLPSDDVFDRLNVDSIADALFALRNGLDSPLPMVGEGLLPREDGSKRSATPKVVYRIPDENAVDVLPSLLSSLGVQPLDHPEDDRQRVLINALSDESASERLMTAENSSNLVCLVRRDQTDTDFPPHAEICLPTTAGEMLKTLAAPPSAERPESLATADSP